MGIRYPKIKWILVLQSYFMGKSWFVWEGLCLSLSHLLFISYLYTNKDDVWLFIYLGFQNPPKRPNQWSWIFVRNFLLVYSKNEGSKTFIGFFKSSWIFYKFSYSDFQRMAEFVLLFAFKPTLGSFEDLDKKKLIDIDTS